MITSDRQLKVANEKLEQLKKTRDAGPTEDVPAFLHAAHKGQFESLITEITQEIAEYETLQKRGVDAIPIDSFEDLRLAPVRYRIAAHLTQEAFAKFVNVGIRQITRYEENELSLIHI